MRNWDEFQYFYEAPTLAIHAILLDAKALTDK